MTTPSPVSPSPSPRASASACACCRHRALLAGRRALGARARLTAGRPATAPRGHARARHLRAREPNLEILGRLAELGVPVEWDDVVQRARGTVGRPHIADAMVAAGHVSDRGEAFARYLADNAPRLLPVAALTPVEAVSLIAESGGAPGARPPRQLELRQPRQLRRRPGLRRAPWHRGLPARARARAARAARRACRPSRPRATAGSDFHRPPSRTTPISVRLPAPAGSIFARHGF